MAKATRTTKSATTAKNAAPTAAEATFNAAVVEMMKVSTGDALSQIMDAHTEAVAKKATLTLKVAAYTKRNAKSIQTLATCQQRLAAARTALLLEWRPAVHADGEMTEIAEEGETPNVTFYNALNVAFDDTQEKEYWLAAQSYKRVKATVESEPQELVDLRKASETAAADFDFVNAVYQEAVKRQIEA